MHNRNPSQFTGKKTLDIDINKLSSKQENNLKINNDGS